jgi:hypothetical protein
MAQADPFPPEASDTETADPLEGMSPGQVCYLLLIPGDDDDLTPFQGSPRGLARYLDIFERYRASQRLYFIRSPFLNFSTFLTRNYRSLIVLYLFSWMTRTP